MEEAVGEMEGKGFNVEDKPKTKDFAETKRSIQRSKLIKYACLTNFTSAS